MRPQDAGTLRAVLAVRLGPGRSPSSHISRAITPAGSAVLAATSFGAGMTSRHRVTDRELPNALTARAIVAEDRIGSPAGAATLEFDIRRHTGQAPTVPTEHRTRGEVETLFR
jgi:hypothetical protein